MTLSRRDILKGSILLAASGVAAPNFILHSAYASQDNQTNGTTSVAANAASSSTFASNDNILVVLQLIGGNDGLNTVVPYGSDTYYSVRPTLAINRNEVLKIDDGLGLHPNLRGLKALSDRGHLAIISNVGYPNPTRSHFTAMEIWETANVNPGATGWLGRALDSMARTDLENTPDPQEIAKKRLAAAYIGPTANKSLFAQATIVPSLASLNAFNLQTDARYGNDSGYQIETIHKLFDSKTVPTGVNAKYVRNAALSAIETGDALNALASKLTSKGTYPKSNFAQGMQLIAQLISGNLGTRIFYITASGYDTHYAERQTHAQLLSDIDGGLAAFWADIEKQGKTDKVTLMTFSEFGRRVAENGSQGTDHGAGQPMFIMGGHIKGGIYGGHPDLNNLLDGDVRPMYDFRQVYATLLGDWLGFSTDSVLNGHFDHIPFFA